MREEKNYIGKKQSEPQNLRRELQDEQNGDLRLRRAIIGLSLVGMGAMAMVTLFQTGVIKHLPDPPLEDFDSDRVNSSDTAYALGVPDGALSLASLAANIPLAAFGGANRTETAPLIPLAAAAAKAVPEAAVAGWYFYQMAAVEKKWCGYCIAGAAANWGIAALSLIEAKKAWQSLKNNSSDK